MACPSVLLGRVTFSFRRRFYLRVFKLRRNLLLRDSTENEHFVLDRFFPRATHFKRVHEYRTEARRLQGDSKVMGVKFRS